MGGGSYRYESAAERSFAYKTSAKLDSHYLENHVFNNTRALDPQMNIKGKIRESCISTEHPNPITVYVGLDVTGSMTIIPKYLITEGFPHLMKKLIDAGIEHVQVCFVGIGDNDGDTAPIQVGQFETDDELQEKWLKAIYLEEGGGYIGPNEGEGYALAWYLAARHTKVESFDEYGRKGILITIGDEQYHDTTPKSDINNLFGGGSQTDVDSVDIYREACEKWNIYHINIMDKWGKLDYVKGKWSQLLGKNLVNTQSDDGHDVPDIIAGIVINEVREFDESNAGKKLLNETKPTDNVEDIVEDVEVVPESEAVEVVEEPHESVVVKRRGLKEW